MELSHSLHKGIFETAVGGIFNKFKIRKRRNTLFFEDIIAGYIRECEKAGKHSEVYSLGEEWFLVIFSRLFPSVMLSLPPEFLVNSVLGPMWANIGSLDSIKLAKHGDRLELETTNENVTRNIGKNQFMAGAFAGALEALFKRKVEPLGCSQTKSRSRYAYALTASPIAANAKSTQDYDRLNQLTAPSGFTMADCLRKGIFSLKGNTVYFRGKCLSVSENTIFHLAANRNLLMPAVEKVSRGYFSRLVSHATLTEQLRLLKTLLQSMGWGIVTISQESRSITVEVRSPPHGLQPEKDNWEFIARTIAGYISAIKPKSRLQGRTAGSNSFSLTFQSS